MSSQPDLGAMLSNVFSALVNAFSAVVNVIVENLPTIITVLVAVGVAGLAIHLTRRFGRAFVGWFRGLLPF